MLEKISKNLIFAFCFLLLVLGGCRDEEGSNHPILRKAQNLRMARELDQAEKEYRKFLIKYPRSRTGLLEMGSFYAEEKLDYERAIYFYKEYLALGDSELGEAYLASVRRANLTASGVAADSNAARLAAVEKQNKQFREMISRQNRRIAELSKKLENKDDAQ